MGFVDDDLVDADLADREKIVFARLQGLEFCFQFLLHAFDALARNTVIAVDFFEKLRIAVDLPLNEEFLEFGGGWNEIERPSA